MNVAPMYMVLPCIGCAIALLGIAFYAWISQASIRINMTCVIGALLSAIAIGVGWQYARGDVGVNTGWTVMTILGCYVSFVTPLGGLIQVITLLADIGVAYDMGMGIESGYGWIVLAVLGSVLVLVGMVLPIGPNYKRLARNDSVGRLLTVSKAPRPAPAGGSTA